MFPVYVVVTIVAAAANIFSAMCDFVRYKPDYFSDFGSERFLGECWLSKEISSWPEAGTPAFPCRRISFTVNLRP